MAVARTDNMPEGILHSGLRWLWVSGLVLLADRISKQLALWYLAFDETVSIVPHLGLTLGFNRGAVFGFLGRASGWQVGFFSLIAVVAAVVILWALWRTVSSRKCFCIALALILGGALGNLYDRVAYGSVIDFIDVYVKNWHWPAFNIADSAICVGAFLLVLDGMRRAAQA